jgi:hypothetical protein
MIFAFGSNDPDVLTAISRSCTFPPRRFVKSEIIPLRAATASFVDRRRQLPNAFREEWLYQVIDSTNNIFMRNLLFNFDDFGQDVRHFLTHDRVDLPFVLGFFCCKQSNNFVVLRDPLSILFVLADRQQRQQPRSLPTSSCQFALSVTEENLTTTTIPIAMRSVD